MRNKSRTAAWISFIVMLLAVLDPMEGAFVALPACVVLMLSAFFSRSRYRVPLYWATGAMLLGVSFLVALSLAGGIGGNSGRSAWWGLLLVPYPLGWLAALFIGARVLREPPAEPYVTVS